MLVILRSTIMTMAMQHKGQEGGMKYTDIRLLHYMWSGQYLKVHCDALNFHIVNTKISTKKKKKGGHANKPNWRQTWIIKINQKEDGKRGNLRKRKEQKGQRQNKSEDSRFKPYHIVNYIKCKWSKCSS